MSACIPVANQRLLGAMDHHYRSILSRIAAAPVEQKGLKKRGVNFTQITVWFESYIYICMFSAHTHLLGLNARDPLEYRCIRMVATAVFFQI